MINYNNTVRRNTTFDFKKKAVINFFVGKAINPAHQNPDLPITFGIKIQLIESLAKELEKMGKQIKVSYF